MRTAHEFRGDMVEEVNALDVVIGDKVMCWLSDGTARVTVTDISYVDLDLTAHGLGHVVHVLYHFTAAPWWVDQDMMRAAADRPVSILARHS